MNYLMNIVIIFYVASAVGYIAFLIQQKPRLDKIGFYLLAAGFVLHTITIGYDFTVAGHIPVHNLRETLSIAGWAIAGIYIGFRYKYHLKVLGAFAAPLSALILIIASQLPTEPVQTKNLFNSIWLFFHIVTVFLGDAAFALAGCVGLLYLLQEQTIKKKKRGFFFRRLPSLELIDLTGYACIIVGFTLLTIGLVTGFAYAKSVWGKFWSWDPKEIWSGIAWLLYAALLHGRISMGWRGRKAAIMSIIGLAVLMFTFFGVNFLLQGHHGIFTKW